MKKALVAALALLVLLAAAVYLFLNYANPQWHPKLYAYQASKTADGELAPGPSFTGMWNNWDADGRLVSIFNYVDGKREGAYRFFAPDGGIRSQGQYKNDFLDGVQLVNQEAGSRTEIPYAEGKRSGVERTFYANGELAVESPWVDDVQDGSVTWYYENGSVQSTLPFYQGKIEGVMQTFADNGRRLAAENYRNDMKNGISEFWRQDGGRDMTLMYKDDLLDGVQTWFHPDGEKARESEMAGGIPNGRWREWDGNGKLVVDEEYEMGQLKKPAPKPEPAAPAAPEPKKE